MNNKGNKILWRCTLLIAATLMAAACDSGNKSGDAGQDDNAGQNNETGDTAIGFEIGIQSSRAAQFTTATLDRIGVFGYSTSTTEWNDVAHGSVAADYFLNKMVVRTEPGTWWYDGPTKYWPGDNEGFITFFAYAPYVDVQDIYTVYPTAASHAGTPKITHTPSADAIGQVDILWSKKADQKKTAANGGKVVFDMNHALTSIAFEACMKSDINHYDAPFTIEILEVGVKNVAASGTLDLNAGQWSFAPVTHASQLAVYKLTPEEHKGLNSVTFHCQYDDLTPDEALMYVEPFTGQYTHLSKSYATMMLLPQKFRDGTEDLPDYPTSVFITYRTTNLLTGEVQEITQKIELASHDTAKNNLWTMGKGITYQFTISLFDGVAVRIKVGAFIEDDKWELHDEEAMVDWS